MPGHVPKKRSLLRTSSGAVTTETVVAGLVAAAGFGGFLSLGGAFGDAIAGEAGGDRSASVAVTAGRARTTSQAGLDDVARAAKDIFRAARDIEDLERTFPHTSVADLRRSIGDLNMVEASDEVWASAGRGEISADEAGAWLRDESTGWWRERPETRGENTVARIGRDEGAPFTEYEMKVKLGEGFRDVESAFEDAVLDVYRGAPELREAFLRMFERPRPAARELDKLTVRSLYAAPDLADALSDPNVYATLVEGRLARLMGYGHGSPRFAYDAVGLPSYAFDLMQRVKGEVLADADLAERLHRSGAFVAFADFSRWSEELREARFLSHEGHLLVNVGAAAALKPAEIVKGIDSFTRRLRGAAEGAAEGATDAEEAARVARARTRATLIDLMPTQRAGGRHVRAWGLQGNGETRQVSMEVLEGANLETVLTTPERRRLLQDGDVAGFLDGFGYDEEAAFVRGLRSGHFGVDAVHFRDVDVLAGQDRLPSPVGAFDAIGDRYTFRIYLNLARGDEHWARALASYVDGIRNHRPLD